MKIVRLLSSLLGVVIAATFLAQTIGLGILWNKGALTRDKRERMAAALYGFDLSLWRSAPVTERGAPVTDTAESRLAHRVREGSSLPDREKLFSTLALSEHELTGVLASQNLRDLGLRQGLRTFLDETETQLDRAAQAELRSTLEVLSPKQAKQMIIQWFETRPTDLVAVVKEMPLEKTKKIFSEFKTPEEADQLHKIMVELGDLAPKGSEGAPR